MQKIINVLAVLSFVGTAGIIGGGYYVYSQRNALIESVKDQVTKAAVEGVSNALPGLLDSAMPKMPEVTGGAVPAAPAVGGGAPAVITGPAIPVN